MLLWGACVLLLLILLASTLNGRGRGGLPCIRPGGFFFAHTGTPRNCLCLFHSRPLALCFHLRVHICFLLACFIFALVALRAFGLPCRWLIRITSLAADIVAGVTH